MIEDANSKEITRDQVTKINTTILGDNPRVCIFAAFNEAYQPLADIARPNWEAYALKHNYALRFYPRGFHLDPEHPQSYGDKNRFSWYYDLKGMCEIVVYLDIDSLFVNMEAKLEWLIHPNISDYTRPFCWTYGEGGPMSGLMAMRTDDATEKHLRYAYEYAAANNNVRHGVVEPNGLSDQDAMARLMNVPPFSSTFGHCVQAEGLGFCYPDTENPNPWIVTCRGGSIEEKLAVMKEWSAKKNPQPEQFVLQEQRRAPEDHPVAAYNPKFEFDRNWVGPPEMKPRVYRTQSEKDTFYAVAVENEYCLPQLLAEDTVIDIGAHIGSFSFLAYKNGSRSVYAYEIDPWHLEAATVNLGDMQDGAALHHGAVVRGDDRRAEQYHYNGAWNSFGIVGTDVPSKSLDEIINEVCAPGERVRFLKIDCEGGEYPILYTCQQIERIQEIAGEYHCIDGGAPETEGLPYPLNDSGLARFLQDHGFEVALISHGSTGNFFARRAVSVTNEPFAGFHFGKLT